MNQFCARCGAQFAPDVKMQFSTTQVLCVECGLSLEDPPEVLPPSESDDDQIAYDLADWPAEDRTIASADLVEMGISYRWEDNLVLVVPAAAEAEVDALLDEIDENSLADGVGLDPAELPEDDGQDGGEEAAEAMSDLFIAADGLQHGTYDEQRVVGFIEASAAVAGCLPPYGIEPHLWARVQKEAAAITTALEKADVDDEATMEAAKALRTLLRQYV